MKNSYGIPCSEDFIESEDFMKKLFWGVFISFLLGSFSVFAEKHKPINSGNLIDITVIPTSFNESVKVRVQTDLGIFIVYGTVNGFKGDATRIEIEEKTLSTDSFLCIYNTTNKLRSCGVINYMPQK